MKLPYLKAWDVTPVDVYITDGLGESGAHNVAAEFHGKSNFNEVATTRRSADGQLVQLNATLTIGKDVAPDVEVLAGYVEYRGKQWKIYSGSRPSNPDGTVYCTRLELI